MTPFEQRVLRTIREEKMLRPGDRVGVAVSGGADSVALLRLLEGLRERLGITLVVIHFDHCLRGAESDADAGFVSELARRLALESSSTARMSRRQRQSTSGISRTPPGASAMRFSSAS